MKQRLLVLTAMIIAVTIDLSAQWTRTGGPIGGTIYTIAADGPNLLATTWDQTPYRFDGNEWGTVPGIRLDRVFAAGSTFFASAPDTTYRSTDHGSSWTKVPLSANVMSVSSSGTTIFATDYIGLHKSTDNGSTWEWIENQPGLYVYIHMSSDGVLYAASADSNVYMTLYRSTDDGANWTRIGDGLPSDDYSYAMACSGDDIYLGYTQRGVYHSSDKGEHWTALNDGLKHEEDDITITQMVIAGSDVFAATPTATFRLEDTTWRMIADQPHAVLAGTVSGEASTLIMGADDGVSRLSAGSDLWESLNSNLRVHDINDMMVVGDAIFAATPGGIFRTRDNGSDWERVGVLEAMTLTHTGTTLLARMGSWTGIGVMRSTDGGSTWTQSVDGITGPLDGIDAMAASGNSVFVGIGDNFSNADTGSWSAGGVYRSTDDGLSWSLVDGLPRSEESEVPVMALIANGTTVVAYTADGVYSSQNDGEHWSKSLDIQVMLHPYPTVAFGSGRFYIGIDDTLYTSTDGMQWIVEGAPIPTSAHIIDVSFAGELPIVSLALPFFTPQRMPEVILIGTGSTWKDISDKFPDDLWFSHFFLHDGTFFGGTYGNSVWEASPEEVFSLPGGVGEERPGALRLTISPNPVTSEAVVSFTLEHRGHVVLTVTNTLGEVVATIVDETMEAGEHTVRHDASKLPEGTWFYRLSIDGRSEVGKVIRTN